MLNVDYWQQINGHFDFEALYSEIVEKHDNGACFVEVGVWFGKSVCYLATEIEKLGKKIKVDAIDVFDLDLASTTTDGIPPDILKECLKDKNGMYKQFCKNMVEAGVDHIVTPIKTTSVKASKLYLDKSLDFVFIDANHSYAFVKEDITVWLPKIKQGGYIAGHDFPAPGVSQAVMERFSLNPYFNLRNNSWIVQIK